MPQFSYHAISSNGKAVNGDINAASEVAALDQIAKGGLTPVSITAGATGLRWWQKDISLSGETQLPGRVLLGFFKPFGIMLNARYSMSKSLKFARNQIQDPRLSRILDVALSEVENGARLADGLRSAGRGFPERFLLMLEAGEKSNKLVDVVTRAVQVLDEEDTLRREIRQSLGYPIVLMLMGLAVLGLLVFYLVPTLLPVFESSNAEPPTILSAMEALRVGITHHWSSVLVALLVTGLAIRLFRQRFAMLMQPGLRSLPFIGSFLSKRKSLSLCETLLLFLSSGAPVQAALSEAKQTENDPIWQSYLSTAEDRLVDGATLSVALDGEGSLDPLARAMIEAGEAGDQLVETLDAAVIALRTETRQALAQAVRMITPVLTLIVGVGVGLVILATITAILDLNQIAF
ncbi:MAG: type II secretion system F family protein [Tateyamaria sp.]|uniref:type II secretion system F family protein n=1 Tax=Tateyamaria sp. TaxID=1929288 RepID=UPI00329D2874